MAELTDAQKVNREVTQKRIATALETLAQNSEAPIGLGMTGATAGQVPVVKTVDENGVPTSYEPGAGGGGGGLPAGGADGDVLVKNGATDYSGKWTNTPPQMGSLAYINTGATADKLYNPGEYLVYNGQLYKVGDTAIGQSETLNPGTGGNIEAVSVGDILTAVAPETITFSYQMLGSVFVRVNATMRLVQIPIPAGYNSISTNIAAGLVLSTREFGKLNAIGFTVSGINYIINGPFARMEISGTGLETYNDVLSGNNTISVTLTR